MNIPTPPTTATYYDSATGRLWARSEDGWTRVSDGGLWVVYGGNGPTPCEPPARTPLPPEPRWSRWLRRLLRRKIV